MTIQEAMEEVTASYMTGNIPFGTAMEAHGIEKDDFTDAIAPLLMPILQKQGPYHGAVYLMGLSIMAGMRMGMPETDIPDFIPTDFGSES